MRHEILEVSNAYGRDRTIWNFEGESAKLGAGVLTGDLNKGYPYFAFEEEWVVGCMLVQELGFTATQIMEARNGM